MASIAVVTLFSSLTLNKGSDNEDTRTGCAEPGSKDLREVPLPVDGWTSAGERPTLGAGANGLDQRALEAWARRAGM